MHTCFPVEEVWEQLYPHEVPYGMSVAMLHLPASCVTFSSSRIGCSHVSPESRLPSPVFRRGSHVT